MQSRETTFEDKLKLYFSMYVNETRLTRGKGECSKAMRLVQKQ